MPASASQPSAPPAASEMPPLAACSGAAAAAAALSPPLKAALKSSSAREVKPGHRPSAGQGAHAAVPVGAPRAPAKPGAQPPHAELVDVSATSGASQRSGMQSSSLTGGAAERDCMPSAQRNEPERQSLCSVAPAASVPVPAGHARHVSLLVAPTAGLKRPREHGTQSAGEAGSAPRLQVPAGHAVHAA
jgi:hypothetical protein